MSGFMVALLASLGVSAWIYNKMMRNTGGNTRSALTITAISGVLIFAIIFIIMTVLL